MPDLIAYYRVSTEQQGRSGLGLEAQESAVQSYRPADRRPIVARYTEVESGKGRTGPELNKALAHARRNKATLTVAKLDRLSRNVAFLWPVVMNSRLRIRRVPTCPAANQLDAACPGRRCRAEAKAISDRTKAALAAAKARGTKLDRPGPGHWNGHEDARLAGLKKARVVAVKVKQATGRAKRIRTCCRALSAS